MGNIKDAIEDINKMKEQMNKDDYYEKLQIEQELQMRIDWLEKGLKEITEQEGSSYNEFENLKQIAQLYLDGEPTTADEFNE
tara:strand:- start:420 stop:665 length:246 start_codon:yes stop_codon:yes gene_type:complete